MLSCWLALPSRNDKVCPLTNGISRRTIILQVETRIDLRVTIFSMILIVFYTNTENELHQKSLTIVFFFVGGEVSAYKVMKRSRELPLLESIEFNGFYLHRWCKYEMLKSIRKQKNRLSYTLHSNKLCFTISIARRIIIWNSCAEDTETFGRLNTIPAQEKKTYSLYADRYDFSFFIIV